MKIFTQCFGHLLHKHGTTQETLGPANQLGLVLSHSDPKPGHPAAFHQAGKRPDVQSVKKKEGRSPPREDFCLGLSPLP